MRSRVFDGTEYEKLGRAARPRHEEVLREIAHGRDDELRRKEVEGLQLKFRTKLHDNGECAPSSVLGKSAGLMSEDVWLLAINVRFKKEE